MEITTARLRIVPLKEEHFEGVCGYALDEENARMMVFFPKASREEVGEFIRAAELEMKKPQPDYYEFSVFLGEEIIGGVSMFFEGQYDRGELGWIIRKDKWGSGYAGEAAEGLMRYFREKHGINRFIAQCDSENTSSERVMKKLGMSFAGAHGGRKNRSSDEERTEYLYEIVYDK